MKESLIILLFAFVLDLYLGDPVYRLHPVRLIGNLILKVESLLERWKLMTVFGGVLLLLAVEIVVISLYLVFYNLFFAGAIFLNIFVVYSCFSIRDLIEHGKEVLNPLERNDLPDARKAVQMLIGRDAQKLDSYGVARAAVESLAENFIDGFLAPLFWFGFGAITADKLMLPPPAGGAAGILFYKVSNTLDSMVGYKNERYSKFGKFSARLDDLLTFLPARFGIPIISLAAQICRLDGKKAWTVGWRDRLMHSSPNAGHAEASVAGALHIRLNGPGIYPHGLVEKPWLGEGTEQVSGKHLKQASTLILCSAFIATAIVALIMGLV